MTKTVYALKLANATLNPVSIIANKRYWKKDAELAKASLEASQDEMNRRGYA
jgi:hypothetical protein